MRKLTFRFKKFDCSHGCGSMKIGVDAVLIGTWTDISGVSRILDVGTGCGVISLICAQRNASARIEAIDIDVASIEEARENFNNSPWTGRLEARLEDFTSMKHSFYDLIISNPPYFNCGIDEPDTPRLIARHEARLSPGELLRCGSGALTPEGRLAMIVPYDRFEELDKTAGACGLHLHRACGVRGHRSAPLKRVMLEFTKNDYGESIKTELILEESPNIPTAEYRHLCKDFYLKF